MMTNNKIELETKDHGAEIKITQQNNFLNSFTSGLAWGVGTVLGATVVAGLILFLLSKLNTIPFFGHYISEIINYVNSNLRR